MTNAERTLILAFIDNSISQLQALRGALSVLGNGASMQPINNKKSPAATEQEFASRYESFLGSIEVGNDDGEGLDAE